MTDFLTDLKVFSALWNHKLFTIQGTPLTLGNIVAALFLLGVAGRISRLTSHLVMKRLVVPHVHDKGAVIIYRRMVYLGTLGFFITLSLTLAGIPLSIFTVVGGALAIGIGFGSQNIVSNFISGLILMFEKPIKVDDTVEIDNLAGTVTEIGIRATKIRTAESKIWIIPNSMFLEKAVLNWTYQGDVLRSEVVVGVAYGSDLEKVRNVSSSVLSAMPFVEEHPAPRVIFDDFGDNALSFRLMFWANLHKVDSLVVARSELRFALDKAFRESKIELAYPQRDLHLRSATPLEVHLKS